MIWDIRRILSKCNDRVTCNRIVWASIRLIFITKVKYDVRYWIFRSIGQIDEIHIDNTEIDNTVITVLITNKGPSPSSYRLRITDCPKGLPPSWFNVEKETKTIPPHHDHEITLNLYGKLPLEEFSCSGKCRENSRRSISFPSPPQGFISSFNDRTNQFERKEILFRWFHRFFFFFSFFSSDTYEPLRPAGGTKKDKRKKRESLLLREKFRVHVY